MESPNHTLPQRPRLHPLVATAAASVIVLSVVGIGVLVMNHSNATPSPYDAPATQSRAASEPSASKPIAAPPARLASATPQPHRPSPPSYDAPRAPAYGYPAATARNAVCHTCGVVASIRDIKVKGEGTGVGGVGGAVVGGLLGNQVGAGRGKALATIAGAVGGAFAGNAIEKNVRARVEHQMVVRLDDGGTRTFTQASPFGFGIGERVRIVDGHVERG